MKALFFDAKPYDIEWFIQANTKYHFELKFVEYKLNRETAVMSKGFDAVCAFVNDTVDEDTIHILYENGIRIITMRCAGYNNVDFKAAYKKIHVVRVKSYSPYAVAEHACALMMALNRKIHRAFNRTRESNFSINGLMGFDLHGKTAGVIGTGQIGQIFGHICKGFGMEVLGYDLFPSSQEFTEYVTLDQIFTRSDIISLHCPLTQETKHMISKESIEKMKQGVMLINTSRGGLIDTEALIEGLRQEDRQCRPGRI
jgi:D-lactate dehydrogenase